MKAPLERCGLSDEEVAHHISDMWHSRVYAGQVETLPPSGTGENAARAAVGLPVLEVQAEVKEAIDPEDCLIWGPNGICLQTKKEAEMARKIRFEKVQIEGTRGLGHR